MLTFDHEEDANRPPIDLAHCRTGIGRPSVRLRPRDLCVDVDPEGVPGEAIGVPYTNLLDDHLRRVIALVSHIRSMPTTRPRCPVTKTDELAATLDDAAQRWPGLNRSPLRTRLALEGLRTAVSC